jgi:hypothetical protein
LRNFPVIAAQQGRPGLRQGKGLHLGCKYKLIPYNAYFLTAPMQRRYRRWMKLMINPPAWVFALTPQQ